MGLCYFAAIISFQKHVHKQPLKSCLAVCNIVFPVSESFSFNLWAVSVDHDLGGQRFETSIYVSLVSGQCPAKVTDIRWAKVFYVDIRDSLPIGSMGLAYLLYLHLP